MKLAFFLINLLCASAAFAAEPASPSTGRLLLGLLFLVAIVVTGFWLIKRAPQVNMQGHIKIVASTSIGTRERLVVVQVGNEQVLLGVTPQQISHLHTLNEPLPVTHSPRMNFQEALQKVLKGQGSL